MTKKHPPQSFKLFLLLSMLIAVLDITFVAITYYQSQNALIASFEKDAKTQHATFRNSFKETVNNMLQIATFVANDPRIQQAFLQGKLAVAAEGGGEGGEQAGRARNELLTIVAPSWAEMTKQFHARQLHFHLGPGSTSFLRVHKPSKFGDNMDNVRYTIVDANKTLHTTSGFETGRVYSGIRGVQPVFAISPETHKKVHVGAVESGISYHDLLQNFAQTFDVNVAVLLTMEHIKANVWPDFLDKRFKRSPPFGDLVIEEASSLDFKALLGSAAVIRENFSSEQIKTVFWGQRYFVLSEIPLRDYRGTIDRTLDNAGKIIFWKDITPVYMAFITDFKNNLVYALTAFILVEILLFLGLRKTTTKLNNIIAERTEELSKLSLVVEQSPTVIVITDKEGIIEYVNHKFVQLTGYSAKEAVGQTSLLLITSKKERIAYDNIREILLTGNEWQGEIKNSKKNGEEYWAQQYSAPILGAVGEITHFVTIQEDITESKSLEKTLQQSEARYGNIFENSLTEIFVFDADSYKFIKVNRGACQNIGYSAAELAELTPLDIKPELTLKQFNELIEPLRIGTKEIIHFKAVHQRKNNTLYPVEIHLQLTEFLSKPAFVAIILDITESQKAEEKLQLSAKVFSETNEGISITDAKGTILDVNPAFCKITGYSRDEVIGKNPRMLSSSKQTPAFYEQMWQAINEHGHWQGEVWNRKKGGTLYAELLSISPILGEEGNVLHYVGIFSDITQSKKQQETLELMAHYDLLTQLPNRVLLADRFTQALAHSQRHETLLAVCFLDLDNFKPVNDLYGHEIGDQLLVEVAGRIKANIRDEDTVSRQGGDEFVLLLGDIESLPQCEKMLQRILEALSKPYLIDNEVLSISASVGVSLYPIDNSDLDTLMRHADQAMYQAKLAGRNRFNLFNAEQDLQNIQKNIKLKEIQQALANGEFSLYYQPKVNMGTGEVFGAEALIRWHHPEQGLIPPLMFLPILEGTELEIQVGNWVINEALTQLDSWVEQGISLEVSVNISSYHLQSPLFIAELDAALALHPKVHSKKFQLEILESSALGDLQSISSIIKNCINIQGVNIALDDFGTGYSSLTHLRNLAAQTIKIDQTFVRDMLDDPNDCVIIDSVIGLASSFNRDVIAEGVETTEHGLMLLIMGCHEAQGYGIARPMPADKLQDWLSHYAPNQKWLAYAKQTWTQREDTLKLYGLTMTQWLQHFENNILSAPGSIEQWPILKRTKCHCGIWIKRAKQEQFFEDNDLIQLEKAHNAMHDIADDLFSKYQAGKIDRARGGLQELQVAVMQVSEILEQCA
ncbi:MAG: PAS domain S-box protein [Methyloprofundus sp.]|nr:PAS domain S-box protein [Methyloprofundus sp.]